MDKSEKGTKAAAPNAQGKATQAHAGTLSQASTSSRPVPSPSPPASLYSSFSISPSPSSSSAGKPLQWTATYPQAAASPKPPDSDPSFSYFKSPTASSSSAPKGAGSHLRSYGSTFSSPTAASPAVRAPTNIRPAATPLRPAVPPPRLPPLASVLSTIFVAPRMPAPSQAGASARTTTASASATASVSTKGASPTVGSSSSTHHGGSIPSLSSSGSTPTAPRSATKTASSAPAVASTLPSATISLPSLLPYQAPMRGRDIFFPEPRPITSLPGRDPYSSVFSTAPKLKARLNKREELYGRFIIPIEKNPNIDPLDQVDMDPIIEHFKYFPDRLAGRPMPPFNKRKSDDDSDEDRKDRKKRNRRSAKDIARRYACPYHRCTKAYGTQSSLDRHVKKKHADVRPHADVSTTGAPVPIPRNPHESVVFLPYKAADVQNLQGATSSSPASTSSSAVASSPQLVPTTPFPEAPLGLFGRFSGSLHLPRSASSASSISSASSSSSSSASSSSSSSSSAISTSSSSSSPSDSKPSLLCDEDAAIGESMSG